MLSNLDKITAGKVKTSGVSAFNELEISKVFPNPDQPRKQFDDIEELAATIKEHGLLQPITVVKKFDGYMIIAGERRYKAHLHNEAKTIKAYIVDVSEEQVEELTLIENIQRNDLTDFELAKHICKLWDSGRYEKKSDLATRIGKSDSYVSKSFNCLKLNSEIIDHIEQNKTPISIGVMDEIARVKDPVVQKEVYEKYNNKEITRDEIKDFKPKKEKRYDDGVFEVLEENSPRENLSTNIYAKKFFDLFTYDEYVKEYGINNANLISFARSLKIGDKVICGFERFSVIAEIKEKAGMEAVVLETNHWFYIRILFKDGTEHRVQVYDITTLNGKKVHPYNFNEIIYLDKGNEEVIQKVINQDDWEKHKNNDSDTVFYKNKETSELEMQWKENEIYTFSGSAQFFDEYHRIIKSNVFIGTRMSSYIIAEKSILEPYAMYKVSIKKVNEDTEEELDETAALKQKIKELEKEIEELKQNQSTPKEKAPLKDEKEISLLELFGDFVTINYTNYDIDMGIDYKQAKKIIDKSKQDSIPFNVGKGTNERAYRLINTDLRTIKDDCIVLIPSS